MTAPPCDFCNAAWPSWSLPCADLILEATGDYGTASTTLAGDWGACDTCVIYIRNGDPDGLAAHVTRVAAGPPELIRMTTAAFRRDVFFQLYKRVLPQLGAPVPLREVVGAGGALAREGGQK